MILAAQAMKGNLGPLETEDVRATNDTFSVTEELLARDLGGHLQTSTGELTTTFQNTASDLQASAGKRTQEIMAMIVTAAGEFKRLLETNGDYVKSIGDKLDGLKAAIADVGDDERLKERFEHVVHENKALNRKISELHKKIDDDEKELLEALGLEFRDLAKIKELAHELAQARLDNDEMTKNVEKVVEKYVKEKDGIAGLYDDQGNGPLKITGIAMTTLVEIANGVLDAVNSPLPRYK